jgi:hypothetical protein
MWLDELVLVSACIFCITFCFLCYTCIAVFKAVRVTVETSQPEQISIRCVWYSKNAYKNPKKFTLGKILRHSITIQK